MTDSMDGRTAEDADSGIRTAPGDNGAVAAVGTYESGEDVVFYDTENPLAWVQAREVVELEQMA